MSRMCLVVVKNSKLSLLDDIKDMLGKFWVDTGLTIFYSGMHIEPCVSTHIQNKEDLIFSISDDPNYDNCEMFLLSDGSVFNEEINEVPFYDRMIILQKIFKQMYNLFDAIEVFIGVSGDEIEDFESIEISVSDFALRATELLNVSIPPSINFRIINESKK